MWPLTPGHLDLDQLKEIMKIIGTPTQEFANKLDSEDVSCLKKIMAIKFDWIKDVRFICRRDTTSKVFQKLRRKTSRKCFLQQTPKVRGSAEPSLRCILGASATLWPELICGSPAVSVLERMLLLDPESRATAAEALALPYFTEFREPEEETEAQPYDHSLDNAELPLSQWKRKDEGRGWGRSHSSSSKTLSDEANWWMFCCFSLFFRSHIHRDLKLQACFVRIQRNTALKQSAVQPGGQESSLKSGLGEKNSQIKKLKS